MKRRVFLFSLIGIQEFNDSIFNPKLNNGTIQPILVLKNISQPYIIKKLINDYNYTEYKTYNIDY
ncbi:MAG: hypothetical protein WDZ41_03555 [Candidatus Babeliales bacterium]